MNNNSNVHSNSRAACHEQAAYNRTLRDTVYNTLMAHPDGLTDREVSELLRHEIAVVRVRVTELVYDHWAQETKRTVCRVTGKTVRVLRANTREQRAATIRELRNADAKLELVPPPPVVKVPMNRSTFDALAQMARQDGYSSVGAWLKRLVFSPTTDNTKITYGQSTP